MSNTAEKKSMSRIYEKIKAEQKKSRKQLNFKIGLWNWTKNHTEEEIQIIQTLECVPHLQLPGKHRLKLPSDSL